MNWKSLDEKVAQYAKHIQKIGDLSLLVEVKKAQEEAASAAKKARLLYSKFIKSSK